MAIRRAAPLVHSFDKICNQVFNEWADGLLSVSQLVPVAFCRIYCVCGFGHDVQTPNTHVCKKGSAGFILLNCVKNRMTNMMNVL